MTILQEKLCKSIISRNPELIKAILIDWDILIAALWGEERSRTQKLGQHHGRPPSMSVTPFCFTVCATRSASMIVSISAAPGDATAAAHHTAPFLLLLFE
ncbi:hypothetical protein F4818DRAFT_436705 [Hypoxylon cercidicola]|nr:hypothetical protein F4818DRAFT_436705 [Hypoxylon cercidicola]